MHDMVASVPLFTMRTFLKRCLEPICKSSAAISISYGFGMPKAHPVVLPRALIARVTTSGACPRIAGPHVPT